MIPAPNSHANIMPINSLPPSVKNNKNNMIVATPIQKRIFKIRYKMITDIQILIQKMTWKYLKLD